MNLYVTHMNFLSGPQQYMGPGPPQAYYYPSGPPMMMPAPQMFMRPPMAMRGPPPVCRYFVRGVCAYGERCRFVHPPELLGPGRDV